MDKDENAHAHAQLKQIILQEIKAQEDTQSILKRIFKRITIIYIFVSVVMIIGIAIIVYLIIQPTSKTSKALKQIEVLNTDIHDLNTRITMQRQYIEMDNSELGKIWENIIMLREVQDSIKQDK